MRIAFITDGRSENFRRLIAYFAQCGDEICVLSTMPFAGIPGVTRAVVLPGMFRASSIQVKNSGKKGDVPKAGFFDKFIIQRRFDKFLFPLWGQLKTLNLLLQVRATRHALKNFTPDVTVAFRTQNEGYVAAFADVHPWALFTQGSDFINMADRHFLHHQLTTFTVRRADALMADCRRDVNFAHKYGLRTGCPTFVLPGNGGVDLRLFSPGLDAERRERLIVFPRGLAPYMRTDVLLASISMISREPAYQSAVFILLATPSTVGILKEMAAKRNLSPDSVRILPFMSRPKLADLLQRADAIVSPSLTDGTPNSMLEAFACGALPVMSNLSSITEWIRHGENGLLFDANDALQLADCLRQALDDCSLRKQAQTVNYALVREKADYERVMPAVRDFLKGLV